MNCCFCEDNHCISLSPDGAYWEACCTCGGSVPSEEDIR